MDWLENVCCGYQAPEEPLVRFSRALGTAMIIFGAIAQGRFAFFWAGVVLLAVCGLL